MEIDISGPDRVNIHCLMQDTRIYDVEITNN